MIYPYTAFLHLAMTILSLASLVYLFYRKRSLNSAAVGNYFNWFLLFFLYNIFLILPLALFGELNFISGIFYNFALLFLGLGAWQALATALDFMAANSLLKKTVSALYLAGIAAAIGLHFAFPEIPRGTLDGNWVLWYSNQSISLFYTLFMFIAGWLFALTFLKGINAMPALLKFRGYCFVFAGFVLPFAAFYYFGAKNVMHIYFAFSFSILGLLLFAAGNILVGLFKESAS
ncbi:MAG: hypothetical protein HYW15_02140 [Candidatus Giovannonibacteria bacterium]|nr:MAG: hypothetical protein HYW15_02140 [Candidatus Giovannonibacteria bacterium]